jgi:hypothetical protein
MRRSPLFFFKYLVIVFSVVLLAGTFVLLLQGCAKENLATSTTRNTEMQETQSVQAQDVHNQQVTEKSSKSMSKETRIESSVAANKMVKRAEQTYTITLLEGVVDVAVRLVRPNETAEQWLGCGFDPDIHLPRKFTFKAKPGDVIMLRGGSCKSEYLKGTPGAGSSVSIGVGDISSWDKSFQVREYEKIVFTVGTPEWDRVVAVTEDSP